MKKIILVLFLVMITTISFGQTSNALYRTSDSLYKVKDYKNAAIAYAAGIRKEVKTPTVARYWAVSSRWALAGEADSAFHNLDIISQSDQVGKTQVRGIENDADFASIKMDTRWAPALRKIQTQAETNAYPQEEFIYGRKDGMALTLVLIRPKIKSNGKAILSVVSGDWVSSYNGIEIPTYRSKQFLDRGYTVFAVMHGSQPRYTIPDEVDDLRRAVRYIRYNATKFGIDPAHIGITGASSGGHLSLMVATIEDKINLTAIDPVDRVSSRVQAVAVLFPPTDLLNWGSPGMNMVNAKELLKISRVWGAVDFKKWNDRYAIYDEVSDTSARNKIARDISPLYAVSADDPPVFIVHGDADPIVPLQQSQSIIARFKEAGVTHNFIIKKGGRHNGDDMNPDWQGFVDWFDKYLK